MERAHFGGRQTVLIIKVGFFTVFLKAPLLHNAPRQQIPSLLWYSAKPCTFLARSRARSFNDSADPSPAAPFPTVRLSRLRLGLHLLRYLLGRPEHRHHALERCALGSADGGRVGV